MSVTKIIVNVSENAASVSDRLRVNTKDASASVQRIAGWLEGLPVHTGNVRVELGAVSASGNITFTGAPVAAETCSINGVTFTARASGAGANEFNIGLNVTATAANLAAAINASVSAGIANVVSATSALGVVTISAVEPGVEGNYLGAITDSLTNATSASWSGGLDGTRTTLSLGL